MTVTRATTEKRPWFVKVSQLFPRQGEWTERDYFGLPETNRIVELTDGVLIMPPHPTDTHQTVALRLVLTLHGFVTAHNLGEVRFAPLPVNLWPGKVREPDVLFLTQAHADRRGERAWGPPDLVMEVVSPGTEGLDRETKPAEYAQAGIAEYWIVDPHGRSIEVWGLEGDAYVLVGKFGKGQTARSQLLSGFEVLVDSIFEG
jgi:Uma2 family endonuclease